MEHSSRAGGSSVVAAPGLSCPEAFGSFPVRVKVKALSHVRLFTTAWTVVYQAPLSMEFARPEYWSELPFPSPGDLPDSGIEPRSLALQSGALPSEPPGSWEPPRPEIKPVYPELAGRFLTTGPPGKSLRHPLTQ